jgi:Tfp pilus assembly protein PilO
MMELFKGQITPRDYAISGGIAAGAVLIALAFYFIIYTGQTAKMDELNAQLRKVRADLKLANETKDNIGQLRADKSKMEELVAQFEHRLPESREIPTLLKQFEGFAGEIGLNVQLSQLPRITDTNKETSPYSVKAWGNFHQIVSFINRLEKFQRYLKVSDLKIVQSETGAEASFTLSTFRFIQPTEAKEPKPAEGSAS